MLEIINRILGNFSYIKGNLLFSVLTILTIVMTIDYITGMLASKKEGLEFPNDARYGWSSKKSIRGIYKKAGYIVIVMVAIITDYLIFIISEEIIVASSSRTAFGIMVSIWLVLNELISILENAGRMGAQLPDFLKKVLSDLKNDVEDSGFH